MAYPIASGMTFSVAANSDSADKVTPTYQFVPKGKLRLIVKGSAIGLNVLLKVNGVPIADNMAIPFTGTTGTMDYLANVLVEQNIAGGRVELVFRNTTGGSLTVDYVLQFEPTK